MYSIEGHRFTNINVNFILENHHDHSRHNHKMLHRTTCTSTKCTSRHKSKPCKYTIFDIITIKIFNYTTTTSD